MPDDAYLFPFFNKYPVFPVIILGTNLVAYIPIGCLLFIARTAALHSNCRWWKPVSEIKIFDYIIFKTNERHLRFIIIVWALCYASTFLINILSAFLNIQNETGYMPLNMFENREPFDYLTFLRFCLIRLSFSTLSSARHAYHILFNIRDLAFDRAACVYHRTN